MVKSISIPIFFVVLLLTLASCGGEPALPLDRERMGELSRELISDLNNVYLPAQESLEALKALDAIIVTEGATYNYSGLYQFYDGYRVGGDAQLDIVFSNKSFVVSRIIFEDGAGYYLRYEYDAFNNEELSVAGRPIGKIEIKENPKLNKAELLLYSYEKTPITLTFRSIKAGDTEE